MSSRVIVILLMTTLFFQQGCDVTFKRKSSADSDTKDKMDKRTRDSINLNDSIDSEKVNNKSGAHFSKQDSQIIVGFYKDKANSQIRKDMSMHSKLSKKQKNKLVIGGLLNRDIQVMPLPLKLQSILSSLPLNFLRVQVGEQVILMNVKSRQILDIIKI